MLDRLLQAFDGSLLSLWGPFGLLVVCGLGLPVPEDIVLVAAGFLGAQYNNPLMDIIVLMYLGILLGDLVIYAMGKYLGRRVLSGRLGQWMVHSDRLKEAERLFHKHGAWVIFVGRYLPGLRAPIFFSAGILHFSYLRFVLMDGLAALVSAPFFVWLGHWAWFKYAENLDVLEKSIGRTKIYISVVFVTVVALVLYWIWQRSRVKGPHEKKPS